MRLRILLLCAVVVLAAIAYEEWTRPSLLLVGNITVDVVRAKSGSQRVPGGSVTYAANVAAAYGVKACVVTAAGPDAELSAFEGHDVHVVDSDATLTFAHSYPWWGNQRVLHVQAQPNVTLSAAHVPPRCRRARTVLLGPLTLDDVDAASFLPAAPRWSRWLWTQKVGIMAQGFQRSLDASGKVVPLQEPSPQLLAALAPEAVLFLSDVETEPWTLDVLQQVAGKCGRVLITRGEKGVEERRGSSTPRSIPSIPVDVKDTNGAGDTFATSYMLALAAGHPAPAAEGTYAASRAVMQAQDDKPYGVARGFQGRRLTHSSPLAAARALAAKLLARGAECEGAAAECLRPELLGEDWRSAGSSQLRRGLLRVEGWLQLLGLMHTEGLHS